MLKVWTDIMWDEYQEWLSDNTKKVSKINALINSIEREGVMKGLGKPEPLKYRKGFSRRIDNENRLIYDVENGKLNLISCKGHYED